MKKDFDKWNGIKNYIENNQGATGFPKEKEVWMTSLGENIGYEQNGTGANFSRPILIIKKFNNQMFWVIPLSTKQKNLDFYFNYIDPNSKKVSAILAQLRLVSIKRLNRKMYEISDVLFMQIRARIKSFL
ncbi:MAG: type II toxin-antitoxin system PemK/MazF family toxin [bacterium]